MRDESFPAGWKALNDEKSDFFSKEFYREADKSHPLYYERIWAIARDIASDDFLFEMHDSSFAAIHLTWQVETTPNFPGFEIFGRFEDWKERVEQVQIGKRVTDER